MVWSFAEQAVVANNFPGLECYSRLFYDSKEKNQKGWTKVEES